MKIFLVTINYNGLGKTLRLIESLRVQDDGDFETLIIDNASQEEDVRTLESRLLGIPPTFRLIKNKANLGFSGGNNVGIRYALERNADWIILINNDTTVTKDFISSLKKHLATASEKIIGIPLQEGDGVAYAGITTWLTPTMWHAYSVEEIKKERIYAIGGGVALHREALETVGLWDERYFLYFEDVDFSERARKKGYAIGIAEHLRITHDVSSTTRSLGAPLLLRYHARNALLFNSIHAPWYVKIALPCASLFGILKQVIKIMFLPRKRSESQAILSGILDFWQGKIGPIHD